MKKQWLLTLGLILGLGSATAQAADPAKCPISGKEVNPEISLNINGKSVAFCCEKCPKQYEAKLNLKDEGPQKCPVSGKAAKVENRLLEISTEVAYFCCGNCPKKFAENNDFALASGGEPGKCPISGMAATQENVLVHNGEQVFFCCENCPKKYLSKIGATDEGPQKCPISGKEAKAGQKLVVTKAKAVYFCCGDCQEKYTSEQFAKSE